MSSAAGPTVARRLISAPWSRRAAEDTATGEVFDTTDLESAEHILRSANGTSIQIVPRGQRRGIRWVHTPFSPQVRFTHTSFAMSCDLTGNPFGVLAIGHLRDGRLAYRSDGSERPQRPGDVFLAAQPDHPHIATVEDADMEAAFIDPALLSQVADGEPGRTRQPSGSPGMSPSHPRPPERGRPPTPTSATRCSPAPMWLGNRCSYPARASSWLPPP